VPATLFVVPGSHPSLGARLMLEHKGIPYRRIDLIPALHRPVLRAAGFKAGTVPALKLEGSRLQGSRTISRALDALKPEPRLFPEEVARRAAVERAEAWGDEVLQAPVRRLSWVALKRDRSSIESFLEGARLGIPTGVAVRTSPPVVALAARLNRASDEAARTDLEALPAMLDQVDSWMEEGILGGSERNAADFQIAPSLRLLSCFDDLSPAIEGRPAGRLAHEVAPELPGRVPPVFPSAWLEPLRG
jgi:glutathione S-transferase